MELGPLQRKDETRILVTRKHEKYFLNGFLFTPRLESKNEMRKKQKKKYSRLRAGKKIKEKMRNLIF